MRKKLRVEFQIVHSFGDKADIRSKLLSLLKETLADNYIERTMEEIEDWIKIKYNHRSNDKFITGFNLYLDEDDTNEIITEFGQKLQEEGDVQLVLKFMDEVMQGNHQKYAKEIFELEMKLRAVISFIFIDTYESDYYKFLEFQPVNPKIKTGKRARLEEGEGFENEFFFLTFGQYRELYLPNIIKSDILTTVFNESNLYEDLKEQILRLGVFRYIAKYSGFLNSIKQDLQSIEELRNCIAHNRFIDEDTVGSYEHAKDGLEKSINAFWKGIPNED